MNTFSLPPFFIVLLAAGCRSVPPSAPAPPVADAPREPATEPEAVAPAPAPTPPRINELTLPPQCKISDAGNLPIFIHNGSPFIETRVRANGRSELASLSIDYGTAACTKLDKRLAKTLGFKKSAAVGVCGTGLVGYPGVTIVGWSSYQVVEGDYSAASPLPGHADQFGILGAGTLNEQMVELDLGSSPAGEGASMTIYQANPDSCGSPQAVLDACRSRWANIDIDEIKLRRFSSCYATQGIENKPPGGGDLLPVVPTIATRLGEVDALLQIDTGRENVSGRVDISVNQTLLAAIDKLSPLKEVSVTTDRGCRIHTYTGEALPSLKLGTRTFQLEQLEMREPACGPPYSLDGANGLLGASILRSARRIVIDPGSQTMLIQWRP